MLTLGAVPLDVHHVVVQKAPVQHVPKVDVAH